jgi:hypothetical protein
VRPCRLNATDVTDLAGAGRVERIPYKMCVLITLRDALRRREVYVLGAGRWKGPDEDLPDDFQDNRDVRYAALAKPLDTTEFITTAVRRAIERTQEVFRHQPAGRRSALGA